MADTTAFSLKRAWAVMLVLALAMIATFSFTDLDYRLADLAYQSPKHFVGDGNWWLETFSHVWMKRLAIGVVILAWGRVILGRYSPRWAGGDQRHYLMVALGLTLAPVAVASLKPLSGVQCPWDLQRYGGTALDHLYWFTSQLNVKRGGCFPAGHASTGFGLFGLVLFWLGRDQTRAWLVGLLVCVIGIALGWGQQLRGAHFLSHTLWSGWVCWAVCLAVYGRLRPDRPSK